MSHDCFMLYDIFQNIYLFNVKYSKLNCHGMVIFQSKCNGPFERFIFRQRPYNYTALFAVCVNCELESLSELLKASLLCT